MYRCIHIIDTGNMNCTELFLKSYAMCMDEDGQVYPIPVNPMSDTNLELELPGKRVSFSDDNPVLTKIAFAVMEYVKPYQPYDIRFLSNCVTKRQFLHFLDHFRFEHDLKYDAYKIFDEIQSMYTYMRPVKSGIFMDLIPGISLNEHFNVTTSTAFYLDKSFLY